LRRGGDIEGIFNSFKGGHNMSVGAGAADTSQESRSGNGGFAADSLSVEAFVLSDFETTGGNLAVFNREVEAGGAFDFADFF